jgi:hypothetical protein
MTPKEKAQELFDRFNQPDRTNYPYVHNAQQCALIAVDEILNAVLAVYQPETKAFWFEVKQEIDSL